MSKKILTVSVLLLAALILAGWYAANRRDTRVSTTDEAPQPLASQVSTSTKASALTAVPGQEGVWGIWGNIASVSASGIAVKNGEESLDCSYADDTSFLTLSYGAIIPKVGDIVVVAYAKDGSISTVVDRRGQTLDSLKTAGEPPADVVVGEVMSVSGSKLSVKDLSNKARFIDLSGVTSVVLQASGKPLDMKADERADLACKKSQGGSWVATTLSVYR